MTKLALKAKETMTMADTAVYTLTDVAKQTGISMPTLQRYKKLYQARIPSEGAGRSQRYPKEALDVFRELKKENIGRRGRPRKNAPRVARRPGRPPAAAKAVAAKPPEGLLTLTQVGKLTRISYPTLLRYVKTHIKEIPHVGTGRARRFKPEAVEVFKRLREESRRGRQPAAAKPAAKPAAAAKPTGRRPGRPPAVVSDAELTKRLKTLEKEHEKLQRLVTRMDKQLNKPYKVVLQRK